ncbi:MAG: general secretion pathway protein L [Halieaceae bacterium]
MSENLSALCLRGGDLLWIQAGCQAASLSDPATVARLRDLLQQRQNQVVFAVPGTDLRLLELAVDASERRHLEASLPFMLEESLIEDIEGLHFPRVALEGDRFGVAVVSRQSMEHWRESLEPFAEPASWVPEPLLLPWEPGQWTLLVEDEEVLLRYGACLGARLERTLLPHLLESLMTEAQPDRVVVYGSSEDGDRALLPGLCEAPVEWRRGGLDAALLLSDLQEPFPELLQGDYAPQLPYSRWWQQWRGVAVALLVGLVLHLLSGWMDHRRLQRQNLALRVEIETVYREVNPRGVIVDAEKQLRRQLLSLRGADTGGGFAALLAPLAGLVAAEEGTVLASLNYNQRAGELRVNLMAPSFDAVEKIRAGLVAAGLSATLENSSRSAGGVIARLRMGAST